MNKLRVIGAGLAGAEAAYQAANLGVHVTLHEMKPQKRTPAHTSDGYAELVCSNSLRSDSPTNAVGLLKEELRKLGSLIMKAADATAVPAGSALAVDRLKFSEYITRKIRSHPNITIIEEEVTSLQDDGVSVIATGPLTSDALSESIGGALGDKFLHFYDAAAPIVSAESIDRGIAFTASRYGKGEACYLNCPFTKEQYNAFYDALINAQTARAEARMHGFESDAELTVFEGCMPVEVMARRGRETLTFGPMKPVGLPLPTTGRDAYAVVQLRTENAEGGMYNLVGFQTHLTFPEQRRVFRMIPGLQNAEFLRYGVMHRNTFINSPGILAPTYEALPLRTERRTIYFAGQMTGVEGYVESCASGFAAGINAARAVLGAENFIFPRETMIGAMAHYVSGEPPTSDFQPMNANFGIIAPPTKLYGKIGGGKEARGEFYERRSMLVIDAVREMLRP